MFTPPPSHPLPGMLAIAAANKILKELRTHAPEHGTFWNISEHPGTSKNYIMRKMCKIKKRNNSTRKLKEKKKLIKNKYTGVPGPV